MLIYSIIGLKVNFQGRYCPLVYYLRKLINPLIKFVFNVYLSFMRYWFAGTEALARGKLLFDVVAVYAFIPIVYSHVIKPICPNTIMVKIPRNLKLASNIMTS